MQDFTGLGGNIGDSSTTGPLGVGGAGAQQHQPFSFTGLINAIQNIATGLQQVVKVLGNSYIALAGNNVFTGTDTFDGAVTTNSTLTTNGTITANAAVTANTTLAVNGIETLGSGVIYKIRTVTAAGAVTVATSDYTVAINKTVGAATVVNLPATPTTGTFFIIKDSKGDAATHNITITPAAGNIDGAGTLVISANYGFAAIQYDGTAWGQV